MQQNQAAWALVGCMNAIAVAIIVMAVTGVAFTFWRIVGGAFVAATIFALLVWNFMRQTPPPPTKDKKPTIHR